MSSSATSVKTYRSALPAAARRISRPSCPLAPVTSTVILSLDFCMVLSMCVFAARAPEGTVRSRRRGFLFSASLRRCPCHGFPPEAENLLLCRGRKPYAFSLGFSSLRFGPSGLRSVAVPGPLSRLSVRSAGAGRLRRPGYLRAAALPFFPCRLSGRLNNRQRSLPESSTAASGTDLSVMRADLPRTCSPHRGPCSAS